MASTRILIAEDERIVGRALRRELQDFGYAVSGFAATAQEAIDQAIADKPDLVLMDIHLQGAGDGIDAALQIHERCSIPVIYLSAYADAATLERAKCTGAFGYLLKPYEERELFTTIEMTLAKHRADQKLAETERWLVATLDGIGDAVIATDPDYRVRYLNRTAIRLTGLAEFEAIGKSLFDVCHLIQDGQPVSLKMLVDQCVTSNACCRLPAHAAMAAKDGSKTPIEGNISPIFDAARNFMGFLLAVCDVTTQRELEQLHRQNEKRQRLTLKMEALSRLAGGMARHLNDQLTAILCNTSLLLASPPKKVANHDALRDIESATIRAAELVERLRVLSDHRQCQFQPLDLNRVLQDRLDKLRGMLTPSIDLVFHAGHRLWQVQADEVQISQAILNLCLDARFGLTEGGQLTLRTENVTLPEGDLSDRQIGKRGRYVRLRVSDNGHGLRPEDCERTFEPIFTTGDPDQCVDLDLAIAFAIAEQHHGWIECQSSIGGGTQFDLYLPNYEVEGELDLPLLAETKSRRSLPTILVADGNTLVREAGRRILQEQGYRVLLAETGDQAVAMFEQEQASIDLVLLDRNIPGQFGQDILEQFVRLDPNVRILFTSSYFSDDPSEADGHTIGVINKPYRQDELVNVVRRALTKPRA